MTPPYRRILAATDFSPYGDAALRRAVWLAQQGPSHVVVANVISDVQEAVSHTSYRSRIEFMEGNDEGFQRELRRTSDNRLKAAIRALGPQSVEVRYETLLGRPHVELIHSVQRENHDLLVVGAGQHSAVRQLLIGSTAKRLVRKCPAPVWVVKNEVPRNVTAVLAAVDFTDVSRAALVQAKAVAGYAQATLHVLHVVDSADSISGLLDTKPAKGEQRTLRELIHEEAERDFDAFLKSDPDQSVPVQRHLLWGNSAQEIIALSQSLSVELVALGSIGRTGLQGVLLGNTAENVLAHCECDVLTVKPPDFVSPIEPAKWQLHPGPTRENDVSGERAD